jgi:hydrophobe/amphiphile efflux-3 (HAE3) family protein
VLGLIAALAIAGTVAASSLETDAGTDTLVSKSDPTYKATQRFQDKFGSDAVVVLVRSELRNLVLTANLGKLLELEGCLSGNAPAKALATLPPVCKQIADLHPSRVVFGPATFLNQAVVQIQSVLSSQIQSATQTAQQAGDRARQQAASQGLSSTEQDAAAKKASDAVLATFQSNLIGLATKYDITKAPRLDDPVFVSKIVFDTSKPAGTPKSRFSYLFPNSQSALVSVRMEPDLSQSQRDQAIGLYKKAVEDPEFKLDKGSYVVSGVPVVVEGLAGKLRSEIFLLLAASILIMGIVLFLVLEPPLRLLPLAIALAASGATFGALSLSGGSLTMASIAVLPVLIGLAVDYAIQFQARWAEARQSGLPPPEAAAEAAGTGGPVIGTAVLATAAGLAVLGLSPVPMVRSFGLLLVLGVGLGFLIALSAGFAALGLATRPRRRGGLRAPRMAHRIGERAELFRARSGRRLGSIGNRALAVGISSPGRVLIAATTLAVCGWIAGSQTSVVSDIRQLAPSDLPALQDVNTLQDETGVSGELNVTVQSDDITNPAVIDWMRNFQQRVLEEHHFTGATRCADAEICPAVSLTDLFGDTVGSQTSARARELLNAIPAYFSQAVISRDPSGSGVGDTANIAFGIPVQPLDQQQKLIDDIRGQIHALGVPGPPPGTTVEVAGLPALAAQANQDLSRSRYWLPPAALLAVALMLAIVYRSIRRVVVPLVPIALATGWSSLVVAAMDLPLNPMSATLGALVIAIATEFSVILAARYEAERGGGLSVGESLRRTYERTGTAVLASGITATAGFAALAFSDIRMLRDFGLVTIVDLAVALAGVIFVLPAVLVWAESAREAPATAGRVARWLAPSQPSQPSA